MTGSPPFSGETEVDIYTKIVAGEIKFPQTMNPELKHLIQSLCTIDQSKRLGRTKGGVETVKRHLWFSGFSWESLYDKQLKAPYIAKFDSNEDDVNEKVNDLYIFKHRKQILHFNCPIFYRYFCLII